MNAKEKMDALFGAASAGPQGGEDWKAKYEEAMKQLESAKVEQGRVKALDAKAKALEKELQSYKSKKGTEALLEGLTEDERGEVDGNIVGLAATLASRAAESAKQSIEERLEKERMERKAEHDAATNEADEAFRAQIDAKYPGFLKSVYDGGDKTAAWTSYLENNAYSVLSAYKSRNLKALAYHIDRFYREVLNVNPPRSGAAPRATDPEPSNGGSPADGGIHEGKSYTQQEYEALEKKCAEMRRKGKFDEYRKLADELDSALVEGRVKG